MKIMMVTPYFYPKVGGLENYAFNIARNLQKTGHEVFIVTSLHDKSLPTDEYQEDIRIIRLPIGFRFSNTPVSLHWYRKLKSIMRTEQPDVVNAHTPVPGIADMAVRAAHSLRIPTVLTCHAATLRKQGSFIFNIVAAAYSLIQRPTLKKATGIIAVSEYVKDCLPKKVRFKTMVVANAIDPSVARVGKVNRLPNRIIFISSLDKTHSWKGLADILRAFSILKQNNSDAELIVIGEGNARAGYRVLAEKLGIGPQVRFMGQVTGKEKYRLIRSATALLAYPNTRNDAFPTVFPEAWACCTPIIAADIGALSGILRGKDIGELVEPNDPKALAESIERLLADPEKLAQYAQNGRRLVTQTFNWPNSSRQSAQFFASVIKPQVCIIHNVISPYRLPIFEAINHELNLHVIFPKSITKDRVWKFSLDNFTFKHTVLKGRTVGPLIVNFNAVAVMLRQRFDVLVCNNDPDVASLVITAVLIAKLRGARIVNWSEVTSNNVDTINQLAQSPKLSARIITRLVRSLVHRYRRFIFWFCNYHIGFSKGAVDYLSREGIADNKMMRTRLLMPQENLLVANPKAYKKRTGKKVLYVGYLNRRKGIDTLIRAFMLQPQADASLDIAGTGPILEELKELAKDDKRITFVGYKEGQEKADLYASSDIFILPTLSDVWGLVIDEAIHYGLAVGCSTAAEAKELVSKSGGFLFPPNDVELLSKDLDRLLNDPDTVRAMQSHNIRRPHIANRSKMADNIIKAIKIQV